MKFASSTSNETEREVKMRQMVFLGIVVFFFYSSFLRAQVSDYGSFTEIYDLVSEENQKYQLKVTLPSDYKESEPYQTLYYLDAWWLSESVLGAYALLHISRQVNSIILVGISLDGDEKDWNIQRTLDFTPSPYDIEKMGFEMKAGREEKGIALKKQNTGGADEFIEFLEIGIFPFMEDKYPNVEKRRGVLGHSYGGLFGFYVMQQKPTLFSDFILISPSLWWNKSELVREETFSKFMAEESRFNLHLTYGGMESNLIIRSNEAMDKLINGLEKDALSYQFKPFETANHNSILPQAIYEGLLFTYGNKMHK